MDSAFASAAFPSCTSQQLREILAAGTTNAAAIERELERRAAVAAGDMTQATAGERLRANRNAQLAALKAASPLRNPAPQDDVDGLALFDAIRQPALI